MEKSKKKMDFKSILQFLCLCVGGQAIYYVAYLRSYFYDAFQAAFNMSNTEVGVLFSAYSIFSVGTYFVGGIITDRFSPRKLLVFSFVATGLLDLWFATFPPFRTAVIIYALMGISTTMTFFTAMIKATRQLGQRIGEGTAQGLLEGGRSFAGAIMISLAIALFAKFAEMTAGLKAVVIYFAVILFVMAVAAWFVFKDDVDADKPTENMGVGKQAIECLKNKNVWLMSLIVLCAYATVSGSQYLTPYATGVFGVTVTVGALLGSFREYFQPVGAFIGGYFADRVGISKMIIIGMAFLLLVNLAFAFMPQNAALIVVVAIMIALTFVILGVLRGQYYATLAECNFPMALSGTAIGLMATIGYTPDIFLSPIFGSILDKYDTTIAYQRIFLILAAFAVVGILVAMVFRHINKDTIAELKQNRKAKKEN